LTLIRVEAPTPGEMRDGMGTIRVEFSAAAAASPGRHHLELRNGHLPDRSVYLANALVPESDDVQIVRQERDVRQQEYRLDYAITGSSAGPGRWLLFGAIVMIVHAGVRLKGSGSTGSA
jgi:hypothetical protein